MTDSGDKLSAKQEAAILALLSTRSVEEAARTAKVPVRTIYRWFKVSEFEKAYRQAKRDSFGQAIARLHYFAGAAVSTLGKIMLDPSTPPATRVRAADRILDHTLKAIETEDIDARVTELERAQEQGKNGSR